MWETHIINRHTIHICKHLKHTATVKWKSLHFSFVVAAAGIIEAHIMKFHFLIIIYFIVDRSLVFVFNLITISAYVIIWPRASDKRISRVNCITCTLPDGMPLQCCNSYNYKLCQFIYHSAVRTSPSLSEPLVYYAYQNYSIQMCRLTKIINRTECE